MLTANGVDPVRFHEINGDVRDAVRKMEGGHAKVEN